VSTLHVSCAAEGDAYIAHSAAMLHSVLAHSAGHDVAVHYAHGPRFPARAAEQLSAMVERAGGSIQFLAIADETVADLPSTPQFTQAMWYRIFLPELLPDVDRILYLDADTIAVDSLAPLWAADLSGYWLAAVTNVFQQNHMHRPAELGLAGPQSYFNSGVLLMNLAAMRRDGCTRALVDFATSHPGIEWPDQDTLNVVLGERRLMLHPRWNYMNSMAMFPWSADAFESGALEEARRRPAIRHFEGPAINKPWHYLCERDLRDVYFEHRRATPWPNCEIEGATMRNALRRRIRVVRRVGTGG
jgi:lipopolysaccharide biosynthesis glycosyltransferase